MKFAYPTYKLEDLTESVIYGHTASATKEDSGSKFLRITDIQNGTVNWNSVPFCECSKKEIEKYLLKRGDIVFARTGATTGKSYLINYCPEASIFASYLIRVRPNEKIDSDFLARFFETPDYWNQIQKNSRGATLPGVNATKLKELRIPLPPLAEQKRIAAILDKADAIRHKRQQAIKLADEFLRATFLDMFGDPVTNPKDWKVRKIEEVSFRVTKGESPKWQGFNYQNIGVCFVTSENVLWGKMDKNKKKYIPETFHAKLKRSQLKENDLLINLVGASVGRTCLVPKELLPANINQAVSVTTLDTKQVIPFFVLQQLLTPQVQSKLLGNVVEFARANISLTNIRKLQIIVPPLTEQKRWMQITAKVNFILDAQNVIDVDGINLFKSLTQRAFRGEL